jgi:hypothetical protein
MPASELTLQIREMIRCRVNEEQQGQATAATQ